MYWGGMILSSLDAAYRYEDALVNAIHRRLVMFDKSSDTFWSRNWSTLIDLDKIAKFPADAYWYIPEDPLVVIPDIPHRIVLLKRRYLNRLRQRLLKLSRQGRL